MQADDLTSALRAVGYIASGPLATALALSVSLGRPLLLEGEAGVGKTAIAQALAQALETRLIRLQCYEGLDASQAIYEWNYQRQLLALRVLERGEHALSVAEAEATVFSQDYLLRRPLLEAISQDQPPVLLIDEIDRTDEAFEAFLLEVLSEFQITVPELGTLTASAKPHVVLTSNGTRALSDALRRRCLYTWVEYPGPEQELAILKQRLPGIDQHLAHQVIGFVQRLRQEGLEKVPGVAETLDWAQALTGLGLADLHAHPRAVQESLVCLLKTQNDQAALAPEVTERLLGKIA